MRPLLATVGAAPDPTVRTYPAKGRHDRATYRGMELDVVAPLEGLCTDKRLLPPGLPTVMGDKQSPWVGGGVRHAGQIHVICVKRINGNGSNTARQTRALRCRQQAPRSTPICAEVQTNTRVRIGRKVCFASSTVEAIRVGRIKGEGADIEHGLL